MKLTPLYVERDDHATGLVYLLTIALMIQVLMEFAVRQKLAQAGEKLSGIYAGQPYLTIQRPSAARLLYAFGQITLTLIGLTGTGFEMAHLTPLTITQRRILELLDLPESLYLQLTELRHKECTPLLQSDSMFISR